MRGRNNPRINFLHLSGEAAEDYRHYRPPRLLRLEGEVP